MDSPTRERTIPVTGLFRVFPPGRASLPVICCECCQENVASWYRAIGWHFFRMRDATASEALDHCCLD